MSDNHTDAQGERAEFESTLLAKFPVADFSKRPSGNYAVVWVQEQWQGWQLRASSGQAQTSAAAPVLGYAIFRGDNQIGVEQHLGQVGYWVDVKSVPLVAAQLADSTAQGAPVDETTEEIIALVRGIDWRFAKNNTAAIRQLEHAIGSGKVIGDSEPAAMVVTPSGVNNTMSWLIEPAMPVGTKLYAAPTAQGAPMTDARIAEIYEQATSYPLADDDHHGAIAFARAILAAPTAQQSTAGAYRPDSAEVLEEFIEQYEWRTDEFCHTPTKRECDMLRDFAILLGDEVAAAPMPTSAGGAVPIHQWRNRTQGSAWHDDTKESAYSRVDRWYDARTVYLAAAPLPQGQSEALEPVEGDVLPAVGAKVLIHLGRQDAWVEHEVSGYYVWGDLGKNPALHRVFVRVKDAQGYGNARLLMDVRAADHPPVTPSGALADKAA